MHHLIYIQQCLSTNDEITKFLFRLDGKNDTVSVYTFDQTQGRGQYGNTWLSFPHQNLAFSMALSYDRISLPNNLFNFHTANVLREFIAKKTEKETKLKWPNDIILFGKKISGMLIEKKIYQKKSFLIVGIGVNILQTDFSHLPKAGSILTQTKVEYNLKNWAEEMNAFLIKNLFDIPVQGEILETYNRNLFRKEQVSVFEIRGMRHNGIIKEVDGEGFIYIDIEDKGLKKFYHKEIELLY